MTSNKGNKIANQFIIIEKTNEGINRYFQSYDSIIVKETESKTFLDSYFWDYSTTTGKYRNIFLNEKKIKNGTYKLTNLNK